MSIMQTLSRRAKRDDLRAERTEKRLDREEERRERRRDRDTKRRNRALAKATYRFINLENSLPPARGSCEIDVRRDYWRQVGDLLAKRIKSTVPAQHVAALGTLAFSVWGLLLYLSIVFPNYFLVRLNAVVMTWPVAWQLIFKLGGATIAAVAVLLIPYFSLRRANLAAEAELEVLYAAHGDCITQSTTAFCACNETLEDVEICVRHSDDPEMLAEYHNVCRRLQELANVDYWPSFDRPPTPKHPLSKTG